MLADWIDADGVDEADKDEAEDEATIEGARFHSEPGCTFLSAEVVAVVVVVVAAAKDEAGKDEG